MVGKQGTKNTSGFVVRVSACTEQSLHLVSKQFRIGRYQAKVSVKKEINAMIHSDRTRMCIRPAYLRLKQTGMIFCMLFLIAQIPCMVLGGQSVPIKPNAGSVSDAQPIRVEIVRYLPSVKSSELLTNDVISGCIDRIDEGHLVTVVKGGQMNRKEAYDRAKANKGLDVLWIQLLPDPLGPEIYDPLLPEKAGTKPLSLIVDFVLFAGGTGKTKTAGHASQPSLLVAPSQFGNDYPLPSWSRVASFRLYQVGRDVGERVIQVLNKK
jgi:hypothetical protein